MTPGHFIIEAGFAGVALFAAGSIARDMRREWPRVLATFGIASAPAFALPAGTGPAGDEPRPRGNRAGRWKRRIALAITALATACTAQPAAAGVGFDALDRYDGLTRRALTIEVPPERYQLPARFLLRIVENVEMVCPRREPNEAISGCAIGSVVVTPSPCRFPLEGYAMGVCDRMLREGRAFVIDMRPGALPAPDDQPCPMMPEYYATLMCHEAAHVLEWKDGQK